MAESLSRQLSRFAVNLSFKDIPGEVIDKAKTCTLHNITSGFLGFGTPRGRATLKLILEEEANPNGATILVDGRKATRTGAVFANADFMNVTNQCDSYYMLTHPGPVVVPAALATSELEKKGGKDYLTAVVAGYEVHNRIAKNFIPSTQARGFRSAALYGIFGAAVATGKLLGLTEDQMTSAIALAVAGASGNIEGALSGGGEFKAHIALAARNGALVALMAKDIDRCSEVALEGEGGFYNAFTGNNKGKLSYVYTGPNEVNLSSITDGLGKRYEMLDVTFKTYPTPGYNNPVIELMSQLKRQHNIDSEGVAEINVEVNWLETLYPSPAFPKQYLRERNVGTIYYMAAYACIEGGYPVYGRWSDSGGKGGEKERPQNPKVMALMQKVTLAGTKDRSFFSPKITVKMKNGSSYGGEYTGNEFKWDFEKDARTLAGTLSGLPIDKGRFQELVETIRDLDSMTSIDRLLKLCIAKA